MEKFETLLSLDTERGFDTRKGLNRSTKKIKDQTIALIESGTLTSEMLEDIAKEFPIFMYRTQITIHGDFGDVVSRERIGQYKNLFQNENGSLGVRYSAIDRAKFKYINDVLNKVQKFWKYHEDSQCRYFTLELGSTKDNLDKLRYLASQIIQLDVYGSINIVKWYLYGIPYIEIRFNLMAFKEEQVFEIVAKMCNTHQQDIADRYKQANLLLEQENQKREQDAAFKKEQDDFFNQRKENARQIFIGNMSDFYEQPNLKEGNIRQGCICKVLQNSDCTVRFWDDYTEMKTNPEYTFSFDYIYYRIKDKKLPFGRIQIEKAIAKEPTRLEDLKWEDWKGEKSKSDIGLGSYCGLLIKQEQTKPKEIKPSKPKEDATFIVDYKSGIAIFGDTYSIKDKLKSAGCSFNPNLVYNGEKRAGWVCSKSKESEIKKLIK